MIVSFPTQEGMYSVCLNGTLLKLIALVLLVLTLMAGYVLVQVSTFILTATPEQFVRIVLFTVFAVGIGFIARLLLSKKDGGV